MKARLSYQIYIRFVLNVANCVRFKLDYNLRRQTIGMNETTFEEVGYMQRVLERDEETAPNALPDSANSFVEVNSGGAREVDMFLLNKLG